jgi:integrase
MIAPAQPWTIARYATEIYCREKLDLSPGTVENLETVCRQLDTWNEAPFLLSELSREALIDWMRWLADAKKNGPATVNGKRALAMAVWNDAADKGFCTFPPSSRSEKIPKRIEPERIPVTWSLAEIDRILAAASAVPGCWSGIPAGRLWVLAILMFWDTGCRLQEVLTARMERIDLAAGSLLIPAENRKGRRRDRLYPLHSQTISALRSTLPSDRELVFPYPYCERTLQKHLSAILHNAGLPADRTRKFHCIRRSAESYAARERGVQWAADAVGHNVAVARKSYVSPLIAPGPTLIDALPRPSLPACGPSQLRLF